MNRTWNGCSVVLLFLVYFCCTGVIQAQGIWASKAPIPTARFGAASGVINGKLYVAGGCCLTFGFPFTRFNVLEVYDPITNSWATKSPMPHAVYAAAAGVINGRLFVVGGQADPTNGNVISDLQIYDPASDTWTTGAPLPEPIAAANAGVVNGKLYLAGGITPTVSGEINTVLVYDPAVNSWTILSPMLSAREFAGTAVINGILYVVGGFAPLNPFTGIQVNTVDSYNPATDTWTSLASMPTARYQLAAGVINGKIYAAGGTDNTNTLTTVESYDPVANTWTTAASMLTAAYGPNAGVINNTFILAGGNTLQNQLVSAVEAFSATSGTTSPPCTVKTTDVTSLLNGTSLSSKPTGLNFAFIPPSGLSLNQFASQCGFTGFDWVQLIDQWPGPSNLFAESAPTVPIIIVPPQPPQNDPPAGGYTYLESREPPFADAFPFYYNPQSMATSCAVFANGNCAEPIINNLVPSVNFFDAPTNSCLPGGALFGNTSQCQGPSTSPSFMRFTTQLVGICNATPSPLCSGAGQPSAPFFQMNWIDDFNGTTGGIPGVRTASSFLPDSGSGTGGITITSINGITQISPSVSCAASPTVLWPPDGKQVAVAVSGTITPGTSAIVATSSAFNVIDSEGHAQPRGSVSIQSDGTYSITIPLVASREGAEMNGRQYTIVVAAGDSIGNVGSCSTVVTVPHDQGH